MTKKKLRFIEAHYGEGVVTEQEYVDHKFQSLEKEIEILKEKIALLTVLIAKKHILIHPRYGVTIEYCAYRPGEARDYTKEHGYVYIKPFKHLGELWVKDSCKT